MGKRVLGKFKSKVALKNNEALVEKPRGRGWVLPRREKLNWLPSGLPKALGKKAVMESPSENSSSPKDLPLKPPSKSRRAWI